MPWLLMNAVARLRLLRLACPLAVADANYCTYVYCISSAESTGKSPDGWRFPSAATDQLYFFQRRAGM